MKKKKRRRVRFGSLLKRRKGGLNFFELTISLLIIAITSVGVAMSFYVGYNQLTRQRWRKQANQLVKAEAEYWMGRIHSAFPSPFEMQHPINNPMNPIPLDPYGYNFWARGGGGDTYAAANVRMESITPVDLVDTAINPDWYEIRVSAYYKEPVLPIGGQRRWKDVKLTLIVPFIPSTN